MIMCFLIAFLIAYLSTTGISEAGAYITCISAAVGSSAVGREDPGPMPSDICDNCDGTGKLGDGTVVVTCQECNGTGKKKITAASGGVNWLTDYATAVEVAEEQGKPILALFTMPHGCPYCVVMDRMHEQNADALRDYVCVRMKTDVETRAKWNVSVYPTQCVVKAGKITRRWRGLFVNDATVFGNELRRARDE